MTPSPVLLMFGCAPALPMPDNIMETSNQPLRLQGEKVCNAKNGLLWLPRKIHYCFASVLLMRVCSTYNRNTPGAPKIISFSFSLLGEEIVTAKKDLVQHRSNPEKTEVAPVTRKKNHLEVRGGRSPHNGWERLLGISGQPRSTE